MHREPLPHDIVRVPGSSAPERVVSVDDHTLTLAPLRSDDARTIGRPAREHIALVGIAAPGRKRRADAPLQPDGPTGAELAAALVKIDTALSAFGTLDAAQILQDPGAEISCGYASEPDLVEQLSEAATLGFDISAVVPLQSPTVRGPAKRYGSGGVDPSDLF